MPATLNLSLTNELRSFIDSNCGDGTPYSTPSEFLRSIIREKKEKLEAEQLRAAVIEGYQDAIEGRSIAFNGNLDDALNELERQEEKGWS